MAVVRVKCIECDNMILPETARANGGLCGPCARLSPAARRELREFADRLKSGEFFRPSSAELASAWGTEDLGLASTDWRPEPEYYKDRDHASVRDLISEAAGRFSGYVFLVADAGRLLSLSFNEEYGVCEFQDLQASRYALTASNLTTQVPAARQLCQACSCCGVGLHRYPSRFHLQRRMAFGIFGTLASGAAEVPVPVQWLDCGDITFTGPGRG